MAGSHLACTMAAAVEALTASEVDDDEIIRSLLIATTPTAINSSLDLSSITKLDLSGRNLSSLPDGHSTCRIYLFCFVPTIALPNYRP
jgi:hypothetical protein